MVLSRNRITNFINQLGNDSISALHNISSIKSFKKGDYLLREGQICKCSFFIEAGVARKFYPNEGKEITTQLFFEQDLAISFESYALQTTSKESIQALTDISVTVMDYLEFQEAKRAYPKLAELDILLIEHYTIWLEERMFHFHTLDAKERYLLLLQNQPHYIKKIPLTILASFLGISLETLSRIRAKI